MLPKLLTGERHERELHLPPKLVLCQAATCLTRFVFVAMSMLLHLDKIGSETDLFDVPGHGHLFFNLSGIVGVT